MKTSYLVAGIIVAILVVGGAVWYSNTNTNPAGPPSEHQQTTPAPASDQTSPQSAQTQPGPAQRTVSIANFAFSPATITIKKGDTVTWTNHDSAPHTATSDTGSFASQTLSQGQSYSHTFMTAGEFPYHCAVHPNMHGRVIVQ